MKYNSTIALDCLLTLSYPSFHDLEYILSQYILLQSKFIKIDTINFPIPSNRTCWWPTNNIISTIYVGKPSRVPQINCKNNVERPDYVWWKIPSSKRMKECKYQGNPSIAVHVCRCVLCRLLVNDTPSSAALYSYFAIRNPILLT